jgi:hypothetical protein
MAGAQGVLTAAEGAIRRLQTATGGAAEALAALAQFADFDATQGTCEQPRGSNRGATLAKFFAADSYKPAGKDEGYPWCAAAVSYWVARWLNECPIAKDYFGHIPPPRTARAFGLSEWAMTGSGKGCFQIITPSMLQTKQTKAMAGDISVLECSHCGIVIAGGFTNFACVEGNTDRAGSRDGWEVAKRPRTPSEIRHLLRFIPRAMPV